MKQKSVIFINNKDAFLMLKPTTTNLWTTLEILNNSGEDLKENLKRIIKKELNLNITNLLSLDWGSVYKEKNQEIKQMNYIAFTNLDKIRLSQNYLDYKWIVLNDFIKKINWKDNKKLLKKVLEKAKNKEIYFNKKERGQ